MSRDDDPFPAMRIIVVLAAIILACAALFFGSWVRMRYFPPESATPISQGVFP